MDKTRVIDKITDFENILFNPKNKGKMVCILFWAEWCGACKNFKPLFFKIIEQFDNEKYIFLMANVATAPDLFKHFEIEAFPTTYIFKTDNDLKKDNYKNKGLKLVGGGDDNKNKIIKTLGAL